MNELLVRKLQEIGKAYDKAVKQYAARVVLGPSVVRVFVKGTKDDLLPVLVSIPVQELKHMKPEQFRALYVKQLNRVGVVIHASCAGSQRVMPGYKWGHAAKVLNLYLREVVLNSRFFSDKDVVRIREWLYVPVDSVVLNALHKVKFDFGVKKIREIENVHKFNKIQNAIRDASKKAQVPPIWFDYVWGEDRK